MRLRNRAGFTLIELVLVILLFSIFVGFSTPLFRKTFSNLEIQNTSFNLSKIVHYAQSMAIIERANYKMNLGFEDGKYWLTKQDLTDSSLEYVKLEGKYGRNFFLPKSLKLEGDKSEIIFSPDGSAQRVQIKITNKSGGGTILMIGGFSSEVELKEIQSES